MDEFAIRFQEAHGARLFRQASRVRSSKSKAPTSHRRSMKLV